MNATITHYMKIWTDECLSLNATEIVHQEILVKTYNIQILASAAPQKPSVSTHNHI